MFGEIKILLSPIFIFTQPFQFERYGKMSMVVYWIRFLVWIKSEINPFENNLKEI